LGQVGQDGAGGRRGWRSIFPDPLDGSRNRIESTFPAGSALAVELFGFCRSSRPGSGSGASPAAGRRARRGRGDRRGGRPGLPSGPSMLSSPPPPRPLLPNERKRTCPSQIVECGLQGLGRLAGPEVRRFRINWKEPASIHWGAFGKRFDGERSLRVLAPAPAGSVPEKRVEPLKCGWAGALRSIMAALKCGPHFPR